MKTHTRSTRPLRRWLAAAVALTTAACADQSPTAPATEPGLLPDRPAASREIVCNASVRTKTVSCDAPEGGEIFGRQGVTVQLTSSNLSVVADTLVFDVTLQNLMNEAIGTPDGVTPAPEGIMVFFGAEPATTVGSGVVEVSNPTSRADFTGSNQAYFTYNGILAKDQVSAPQTWKMKFDPGVSSFTFRLYVQAEVQPLLVINEIMVNPLNPDPANPSLDTDREWVEIYNAGTMPVNMEGMLIADSAASGRRPYHRIASPLVVQPGGYVVIGASTNTVNNGGVPVDYSYGGSMAFANSLDAFKISRTSSIPGDTLTIDRTQFASAAISAQAGISRELKNPALDNSNLDGSNWADASVTAVYGNGGRGTPKAQNSTYTP